MDSINYTPFENLKICPLAFANVTLLPSAWNTFVITRWKKSGSKVGSFSLNLFGMGGGATITDEYPSELSLQPQKLVCAYNVRFNPEYPHQGFYRFWDCGSITENVPQPLLDDILYLATNQLE